MSEHVHGPWGHQHYGEPLVCIGCGAPWPGYQLPVPPPRVESIGLADHISWRLRVRAALDNIPADG